MKNKIIILLVIYLSLNYSVTYAQSCFYSILFEGLFNKNKVSFYINGEDIFKEVTLNHNTSTGNSDISLLFAKENEHTFYVANTFSKATHFIQPYLKLDEKWGGILHCKLVIDKKEYFFTIDVNKGHYMGFRYAPYEKEESKKVVFYQGFEHFGGD